MLAFDRKGSGLPLVFVHAYPLNRKMWSRHVETLSRHFQILSVDLPGFGDSSPLPHETVSMDQYADALLAAMDGAGIKEKAVFTGVSMGGYILFRLAAKAPDRIRALVLASTRSSADTGTVRAKRFETIEAVRKKGSVYLAESMPPSLVSPATREKNPALLKEIAAWIQSAPPEALSQALRGMAARPDSTSLLSAFSFPVLVLSGADDGLVSVSEMKGMADRIPGARHESVEEAGHLINLEKPAEFEDRFLKFLKRSVL